MLKIIATTLAKAICLAFVATLFAPAASASLFLVGNSLTNDVVPRRYAGFLGSAGREVELGWHIRTASTLSQIRADPSATIAGPSNFRRPLQNAEFGAYGDALPNFDWDAVTLQSHPRNGATLGSDATAFLSFIELAQSEGRNTDTTFYLYSPWAEQDEWHLWDDPAPATNASAIPALAYHQSLVSYISDRTDADVRLLPIGHIWNQVRLDIENNIAPGALDSLSDLYRDIRHSSDLGRHINGLAVALFTQGIDPRDLPVDSRNPYNADLFGPGVASYLANTVFEVSQPFLIPEPSTLVGCCLLVFAWDGRRPTRD